MVGVVSLLADAHNAGLGVLVNGDKLVVRGPRSCQAHAKALLGRKAEIITYLAASTRRPALSPVPLTVLYPAPPGREWMADKFYQLRQQAHDTIEESD